MYDRAERSFFSHSGSTNKDVGPGSYDIYNSDSRKIRADGYAPFLSMTGRDSIFISSDEAIITPGPGNYNLNFPNDKIKGGKVLSNKSKRFKEVDLNTPGPGQYDSQCNETFNDLTNSSNQQNDSKAMKVKQIISNRTKLNRKGAAPSIPSPGKAYGFEENEDGSLLKQVPPNNDGSLGPAFYAIDNQREISEKKGTQFGNRTSKRPEIKVIDGPGPGAYNITEENLHKKENVNIFKSSERKYESNIPRYYEMIPQLQKKNDFPGPGQYEVNPSIKPNPSNPVGQNLEVEHPPFGTLAKRFSEKKNNSPAPGSYNETRTSLEALKKISGLKRSPFGQTSVRFAMENNMKKIPGPGTYTFSDISKDSLRRVLTNYGSKTAFGTTSQRSNTFVKRDAFYLPGPSDYVIKEKVHQPKYEQQSYTFSSLTSRFDDVATKAYDTPAPGSYDVQKSFLKGHGQNEQIKSNTADLKKRNEAFTRSTKRFDMPRDFLLDESDPLTPAPGSYEIEQNLKRGNMITSKESRFKKLSFNDVPGPGTYEYSPLVKNTLLKNTFNATLNNNSLSTKLDHFSPASNQQILMAV